MRTGHKLLLVFAFLVAARLYFSLQLVGPSIMGDETVYAKTAESYWHGDFSARIGSGSPGYPPLYSLLIAPAYAFGGMETAFRAGQLINALVSSLVLLPAYLISRRWLGEGKAIAMGLLVGLIPSFVIYSGHLMSENLYFPLFLLSAWLAMESLTKNDLKSDAAAGICLACLFLTKVLGVLMLAAIALMVAWLWLKRSKRFGAGKLYMLLIGAGAIALLLPFNALVKGAGGYFVTGYGLGKHVAMLTPGNILGPNVLILLGLLANALQYYLIATLVVFFVCALLMAGRLGREREDFRALFAYVALSATLLLAASSLLLFNEGVGMGGTGRAEMGRYLDPAVAGILLVGAVGIERCEKLLKKPGAALWILALFAAAFLFLLFARMGHDSAVDSVNRYAIDNLPRRVQPFVPALAVVAAALFVKFRAAREAVVPLAIIFFLYSANVVNGVIAGHGAYQASVSTIGKWLGQNDAGGSLVVVDADAAIKDYQLYQYIFWSNERIEMRHLDPQQLPVGAKFIITDRQLPLRQVASDGGIRLYRTG